MGMIKDFLRREEIETRAEALVNEYFTDAAMKKIATSSKHEKDPSRKLDAKSRQLKKHATDYIRKNRLGVYGKSKFLKVLQEHLLTRGLDGDVVRKIIKSLVMAR